MYKYILLVLFLISVSTFTYGQVGKIFSKEQADQLYGPVRYSFKFNNTKMFDFAKWSKKYLMFKIKDNKLTVANDERFVIYPEGTNQKSTDSFLYYSVSMIDKLIVEGQDSTTSIELRDNGIISITNGSYTLETATLCPPVCPE
ncbi:MAG: hypothetical protein ACM3O3_00055 [Syntrophothermus sp.]